MTSNVAAVLQSGNLFTFVMNNPVGFVDPTGLWATVVNGSTTNPLIGGPASNARTIIHRPWDTMSNLASNATTVAAAIPVAKVLVATITAIIAALGIDYGLHGDSSVVAGSSNAITTIISDTWGIIAETNLTAQHREVSTKAATQVHSIAMAGGIKKEDWRGQSVYVLMPESTERVFYVGRTNNPARREGEHQRNPLYAHRMHFDLIVVATDLSWTNARILEQTLINGFTFEALDNKINAVAAHKYDVLVDEAIRAGTLWLGRW